MMQGYGGTQRLRGGSERRDCNSVCRRNHQRARSPIELAGERKSSQMPACFKSGAIINQFTQSSSRREVLIGRLNRGLDTSLAEGCSWKRPYSRLRGARNKKEEHGFFLRSAPPKFRGTARTQTVAIERQVALPPRIDFTTRRFYGRGKLFLV